MKRGSSVLQPPCDAAKRHTHPANAHTQTHTGGGGDARSLSVSNTHAEHAPDTRAAGSSPFPAATSLFSPDVSTKMASDLLIRLSEATQKAQVHPGSQAEAEPQRLEVPLEVRGGQQDEPGLALSPDGPGASPEPPSLTHTPDGNTAAATDTLASELLRQLAERQEVNCPGVRVKEEEEPVEVDAMVVCDLVRDRPAAKETSSSSPEGASRHRFTITPVERDLGGNKAAAQSHPGAQLAEPRLSALKMEDSFFNGDCQSASSKTSDSVAGKFQFRVKMEEDDVSRTRMTEQLLSGAKMEDQFLFKAKLAERPFSAAKTGNRFLSGVKTENGLLPGAKLADRVLLSRAKTEEQLFFGAKMEDQCLRAVLWQDMSVNLASTLLHQLSERVSKSNNPLVERSTPPTRSSPVLKLNGDPLCSPPLVRTQDPPHETQTCHSRSQTTGYFYRCHVCGFETEGCGLFQSHMTGHRQWERASFSLHCCACDHSTNQEAEMRAHADTHARGDTAVGGGVRCPITPPAASASSSSSSTATTTLAVAVATPPERSTSEHRCRICQRSFPGQQELLVHFQGHRQGNQYRCDRCGHLTRTANKLVEHVRVHTGERPFTCHLCPYSAKRRDSLRLHCKVKHAAAAALVNGNAAADAPGDVHTHRSYAHGDNQRSNKHVQRLHTAANTHTAAPSSSLPPLHPSLHDRAGWRDLSPLLPITTLISLKPRAPSPPSSSSSSSSSTKHSFLSYLGLTTSLKL
ncbi:uncharacterized protein LOC118283971 isoform X2 [Scophthalmus maximus]|uniref:uncharacterized protein LOC118283971 isoform X2 n=1 Tax=Scophthalmus maximus TaxID=52904 RepID=UPI0015E1577E|nr:uncharacterized protein LOC118283971 isoform X2 [Scophthalmus maximus]